MLRLILVVLFVLLFLLLTIPVLLLEWVLGKLNQTAKDRSCKALVGWAFRCITALSGVTLIVKGKEKIPTDTPVLYVGNHRSYFDVVLSLSLFPRVTGYVAKKEMIRIPFLRLWMKNIHCVFLDRDNIKEGLKTILSTIEETKKGYSFCIFPEGTRNRGEEVLLPFHEGSFKIADKGNIPIVPMTIVGSGAVLEEHFPFIKKSTVIISFGEPILVSSLEKERKKNLGSYVSERIRAEYIELKKEIPA